MTSETQHIEATTEDIQGTITERRIAWLTLVIGATAALATGIAYGKTWAEGLMIGAVLAWFNFRWLRQGMDALVKAAEAQVGAAKTRVPVGAYFRALFRYALIAMCLYVIFKVLGIPLVSMVFGLCALGAAAIAASVYEVWHPAGSGTESQAVRGSK